MKKIFSFLIILLCFPVCVLAGPPCPAPHILYDPAHVALTGGTIDDVTITSKFKLDHTIETLNADRTILITDKSVLWFDCNGSDRNVTLPAEASSTDLVFTFYNDSDGVGEDLTIRDDTPTTLITIGPGQGQRFSCDGTTWETWFDSGTYYDAIGDLIGFYPAGSNAFYLISGQFYANAGAALMNEAVSATNPTLVPTNADVDTGIGSAAADRPVIISGGVPSQVWGTVVTLSTAQVNALQATPITIVAAQGANTWIELVTAVITYDYATAAFTVAAGEDLVIEYGDGTDATASIETTGFLDQADDEIRYYPFVLAAGADPEATINQVLRIKNTGAGETADGGGEVDVRVVYRVYTTGF